jgi:hypothetical protein
MERESAKWCKSSSFSFVAFSEVLGTFPAYMLRNIEECMEYLVSVLSSLLMD